MSHAREMLDARPTRTALDPADLAAAIDACDDAAQACTSCADACLAEKELAALRTCIALDVDCADVCALTARVLSRQTRADTVLYHRLLQACVHACSSCAKECAGHADHHAHCAICAQACRACERACQELLDAEAMQELRLIAGG